MREKESAIPSLPPPKKPQKAELDRGVNPMGKGELHPIHPEETNLTSLKPK
jgi:hypothetical protein